MSEFINLFIANLHKFIFDLNRYSPHNILETFLSSFNNIDFNLILVRYLKKVRPIQDLLKSNNEQIFEEPLYLFPDINISEFWPKLQKGQKRKVFTYLQLLYVQAELILEKDNKNNIDFINNKIKSDITLENELEEEEFNPFLGLGVAENSFNLEGMKEGLDNLVEEDIHKPGFESILAASGIEKLIDVDDILKKLNDMTDADVEETTSSFQKLFHGNEKVTGLINDIIINFKQELSENIKPEKNKFADVMQMAKNVAEKTKPNINKEDINIGAMINSFKNMTNETDGPLNDKLRGLANLMEKFTSKKNPSQADLNNIMNNMGDMLPPNMMNKANLNNPHSKKYVMKNKNKK